MNGGSHLLYTSSTCATTTRATAAIMRTVSTVSKAGHVWTSQIVEFVRVSDIAEEWPALLRPTLEQNNRGRRNLAHPRNPAWILPRPSSHYVPPRWIPNQSLLAVPPYGMEPGRQRHGGNYMGFNKILEVVILTMNNSCFITAYQYTAALHRDTTAS